MSEQPPFCDTGRNCYENCSGWNCACGCHCSSPGQCKHGQTGYCFDCVRERHNQEVLDGKYDDMDDDYASTPHPSAYYRNEEQPQ